ncbi:hypothetical protein FOL46_008536 [Perkinsus olseni]|uniref:Uncharacterized protein n=1 Tax=Perkinsus olseni TaxID=32597 RepID=A0A7J6L6K7_PEROL|nr:hypothetical protein FOL46_008536 [Perkinsus olseni]
MATVPYFSLVDEDFTRKLTEEATSDDADHQEDRKLMYKWVLWEQLQPNQKASAAEWKDLSRQVCTFGTVGEFWRYWRHVPQPSELLSETGGCRFVREGHDGSLRVVESMMLFREGIKPEWEDPLNAVGGHLQFSLAPSVGGKQIDEYWNNIVLAVIGNTLPHPEMITGLRLCDKLYTKRGPPQGSVRIEVWFTNMGDGDKVDELTKGIQECICTRLDGSDGSKMKGEDDIPHYQSSLTTVTSASSDIAQLREELVSLRRLIQKAYPVLEVSCSRGGDKGGIRSWIPYAFEAAYKEANLLPTEDDLVRYALRLHEPVKDAGEARRGLHESRAGGSSNSIQTRCVELHDPSNGLEKGSESIALCLPVCHLLCVEQIIASVSYLLNEHIYPSMDNISLCLHLAFSLRSITLNDILTCAKFGGVEDGRLIISGDVILLLPEQAPWNDTSSNNNNNNDATTVFTCYPSKYTPYPSDAAVTNKMDKQLLAWVDSFYDRTMIGVSPAGEHPSPFRLSLLAKKFAAAAADMVVTTASMGLLTWLFQRCIAKDKTNTPLPAPSDSSTLLLRCPNPQCPLWPECCGHQSIADGTTRKNRPIVELRTILIGGGNDVLKADGDPDNGHSSSCSSSSSSSSSSSNTQVGDEVLPNSATHIAAEGRMPAAESGKHRPSTEIQHDDTALAREQLLFIHCFKNELLAGQGILLNQVNNLCKVRCGRTVRYREFGFGKLRDFLEDIKGLQVVGEKFQMTIRLTDVVEFDLFIREANARKSAGSRSSTASPVIGVTKRGGPLAESDGGNMVGDGKYEEEVEELKHLTLPQLIPEDVIDKLRYMFSCEHYQIEASVFVSLFKNRSYLTTTTSTTAASSTIDTLPLTQWYTSVLVIRG